MLFRLCFYTYASTTRYKVHTYAVYSCVWRLWVVFLERDGGALGIFKSPVRTYDHAWTFLSKRSRRRMPPAKRSALYVLLVHNSMRRVVSYQVLGVVRACSTAAAAEPCVDWIDNCCTAPTLLCLRGLSGTTSFYKNGRCRHFLLPSVRVLSLIHI